MNKNTIEIIEYNQRASFSGEYTFPEVVRNLVDTGIERYYVDLVGLQKIYYAGAGSLYVSKLSYPTPFPIGEKFSEKEVIEALRAIQKGRISYPDFLDLIMKAGTVNYTVFIHGKQVHYVGSKGEIYIENFPGE